MTSYESAILLAKALDGKKGEEIKVLKTEGLTTLADYFVICTATSTTQIKAMSDACEEAMEKNGEQVHHIAEEEYPTAGGRERRRPVQVSPPDGGRWLPSSAPEHQ